LEQTKYNLIVAGEGDPKRKIIKINGKYLNYLYLLFFFSFSSPIYDFTYANRLKGNYLITCPVFPPSRAYIGL